MRKVDRSIPMYFLPYMLFSAQTPYRSQTSDPSSEARITPSPYFFTNLSWLFTLSFDTPTTTAPASSKAAAAAVKACASEVQPEVSSLG
jgi:hypothetical protein